MRYWAICVLLLFVNHVEVNLLFLIKPLFLYDQKVKTKISIPWERNKLLIWNKKQFSSFLKGFHWSKIIFLGGERPTLNAGTFRFCNCYRKAIQNLRIFCILLKELISFIFFLKTLFITKKVLIVFRNCSLTICISILVYIFIKKIRFVCCKIDTK